MDATPTGNTNNTNTNTNTNTNNSCISHNFQKCVGNSVFWYDSCGNQQDVYQACSSNQTCSMNGCVTNYNTNTNTNTNNNTNTDYIFHNTTKCVSNIAYWYDSLGNRQGVYKNCGAMGAICQSGQCAAYTNTTYTNTTTTNVVNQKPYSLHDKTKCNNNDVYWYDSKGLIQDIYQSCSDHNQCTLDTCSDGQCQNILKCDGSTCNAGSADYIRYCGTNVSCTSINPSNNNTPNNTNTSTAAVSENPLVSFFKYWFIWIIVGLVLIFLFVIIFRRLSSSQ